MESRHIFWIIILVIALGLSVVVLVYRFGRSVFFWLLDREWPGPFLDPQRGVHGLPPKSFVELVLDYRERRNDYWVVYGQVVIAVVIAVLLTILLLTKTISAEAGLPILSAISGFAIAKGTSGSRNQASNVPPGFNE